MRKKLYIPDTNILMYDCESVYNFEEHDICVPMIVIDELDGLNKNPSKSIKARAAIRVLDKFLNTFDQEEQSLGEGLGNIISIGITPRETKEFPELNGLDFKRRGGENKQFGDNMLIASIIKLKHQFPQYDDVILVTNDKVCSMRARDRGITAERYRHEDVKSDLYTGKKILQLDNTSLLTQLHKDNYLSIDQLDDQAQNLDRYNQCYIIKNHQKSGLARYKFNPGDSYLKAVLQKVEAPKIPSIRLKTLNAEQTFAWDLFMDEDIHLVTVDGIAGTGKTLWALLAACEQVYAGKYENIVVARPDVALSGKQSPWLPGSLRSKTTPLVQPIMDNLKLIINNAVKNSKKRKWLESLEEKGFLTVESLTWIRGRTLSNCIIIIDEAQNCPPSELKTIITRAGEGSKIFLVGDTQQVDSPFMDERSNGLSKVIEAFSSINDPIYAHMVLIKGKRSKLATLGAEIL